MALKKSELYSSLWSSCDELRGGMDASQYKDYVLVLLFIKYVSDKYAGMPYAPITVPPDASFKDMVALKGKSDIGDQINKKIIGPLANANKLSDMPDFNDPGKLGSGKEMVERLTNLIAIFENKSLDFSCNTRSSCFTYTALGWSQRLFFNICNAPADPNPSRSRTALESALQARLDRIPGEENSMNLAGVVQQLRKERDQAARTVEQLDAALDGGSRRQNAPVHN